MNLHSIHKRRIQFSRQRWRDGEGRYLKGATDMKTPDLFRPKGKKGIYYANTTYEGIKLSDCLHTNDEVLAYRRLVQILNDIDEGRYQIGRKSFDWCLEQYKKNIEPHMSKNSVEKCRSVINCHLLPAFKGLKLKEMLEVDPDTKLSPLRSFFWDRKHYPEGSVRKIATTTERIIRQAHEAFLLRDEFPNPDPTLPNDLPYSRSFFQKQFLSEAELHEIIDLLKDRWKDLAILMAYSGLDLAEAINLTWNHIDKKNNMIVRDRDKMRHRSKKKVVTRRIPIRGELEKMLRRRFKNRKLGDEKIFHFVAEKCADPRKDGKALKWANRMFQWDWKHAQEKSSVEWNVRVKDLRHFFGSTMLNRGVDSLEIANQMGHQDLNMLRERYGHYTDEKLHNSSKVWDYSEVNKSQIGANSKSW